MKLLYVKWIDAVAPSECLWMDDALVQEHLGREMLIEDVGFVLDETKDYLTLVAGLSKEPEDSDWSSIYHRMIRIPIACIKKKRDLTRFI